MMEPTNLITVVSASGFDLLASAKATEDWRRDPDFDCSGYTQQRGLHIRQECDGDGHYLCNKCTRLNR